MFVADVFCLVPFVIIGSLALTDIINFHLSTISIIVCFFILPLAYFVGWVTIVHYVVNKKIYCEYGMWSLPGYLWSIQTASLLVLVLLTRVCNTLFNSVFRFIGTIAFTQAFVDIVMSDLQYGYTANNSLF